MAKERLIVFTRYPEPGKTKTRLIPALGAQEAATLHRQMTEHTLSKVTQIQSQSPLSIEVHFTGGNLALMQAWLGSNIVYRHQGPGDLGSRMTRSHQSAVRAGIERVAIVGTDCPGLNAELILEAFQQLHSHDLVLGPAMDGGYYLIGLRCFIPALFSGINWGTAEVLQQTVHIANKLDLSVAYLTQLADVDRPEDLPVWEQGRWREKP
jgi:rSAM/selenodomain-associated transferase 1